MLFTPSLFITILALLLGPVGTLLASLGLDSGVVNFLCGRVSQGPQCREPSPSEERDQESPKPKPWILIEGLAQSCMPMCVAFSFGTGCGTG